MNKQKIKEIIAKYPKGKIPSKNLGIFLNDEKIEICHVDKSGAHNFQGDAVDESKVTLINDMFYVEADFDNGPYGNRIKHIYEDTSRKIFSIIKSDKSIVQIRNLSIHTRDINWYTEDSGVYTVNTDPDKAFSLRTILKAQNKIEKFEKIATKKADSKYSKKLALPAKDAIKDNNNEKGEEITQ